MDDCLKLQQVYAKQLESQLKRIKLSTGQETLRLERIKSQLIMTEFQKDSLQKEVSKLNEMIQLCNEKFTSEFCIELRSVHTPSSSISEICDKFLLVLDIKDRSWNNFKKICKNFRSFKNLITNTQSQNLQDSIINEILPLWKGQNFYKTKLEKFPAFILLLDWIGLIVELNLKKEILKSSEKRLPELEKSIKKQESSIESLKVETEELEKTCYEVKKKIRGSEIEEFSEESHCSKTQVLASDQEKLDKQIFVSAVNKGTASGGLMQKVGTTSLEKSVIPSISPNFSSKNLYIEVPVSREYEEKIIYEGQSETVGCCSIRFLCF